MKILFLSDNFPPEMNALANRTYEHAKVWVARGHDVTVITCFPNFPEGRLYDGYSQSLSKTENLDGIKVVRVPTFIARNKGVLKRGLDHFSFMAAGFLRALFEKNTDVVIGTSPQFLQAFAALAVAKIKRIPFVLEIRDLWPDSILAVGAIDNQSVIAFLKKMESMLYRHAAEIIVVTKTFKNILESRGVPENKISVVFNGVDTDRFKPLEKCPFLCAELKLKNKFVVGYIGTFGMAHALCSVLECARILRQNSEIHFLFVGGGADSENMHRFKEENQLGNVTILPFQPHEKMNKIWSLCDVGLVHLKNHKVFKTVIPSKIFEAIGMGVPVLLSMPKGEAVDIVKEHKVGVAVRPEHPQNLAEAVKSLQNNLESLNDFRKHSRETALLFSREEQALIMLQVIQNSVKANG